MRVIKSRRVAGFLAIILLVNMIFFGLANFRAEAGLWDDQKGNLITVAKGFLLLWVINLMRSNATGDGGDDLITSTIKKGLNLDREEPAEPGQSTDSSEPAENQQDSPGQAVIIEDIQDEEVNSAEANNAYSGIDERDLVELVNRARLKAGLNALEPDQKLSEVARQKARDMIDNNYFDHQSPTYGSPFEMIKAAGIEYSLAGENLAGADTVEEAFDSLLASPDHRDNILKERYDRIGVGVLEGGPYGLMIVQLFLDSPEISR